MLLRLLSLPVTGPLAAVKAVADEAARVHYDPATIIAEFEELKEWKADGRIDDVAYKEARAALNARLKIANERRAQRGQP